MPTYAQDVLGAGPLIAGLTVAALTLGWPITAAQSGRVYLRIGFRKCALIGCAIALVGCAQLTLLGASSSLVQVAGTCFVIGMGMGLVASPTLVAAQSSVEWQERGVVTGSNLFSRSSGSAVGVAIFGAIANSTIGTHTPTRHSDAATRALLTLATQHVFYAVLALAVTMMVAVSYLPRGQSA